MHFSTHDLRAYTPQICAEMDCERNRKFTNDRAKLKFHAAIIRNYLYRHDDEVLS